ncbi:hypothetical protein BH18GEM1_BH18GEM1_00290 [soil metagenome]
MSTVLILLLVLDCVALTVVVLLQSGKGGGLAAGFGGAGTGMEMMGSRQTASFLHNATKWLGGAFLVICFAISILTVRGSRPRSLIEAEMQQEGPAELPGGVEAPTDLQDMLGGEPATEPGAPAPADGQTDTPTAGSDASPANE